MCNYHLTMIIDKVLSDHKIDHIMIVDAEALEEILPNQKMLYASILVEQYELDDYDMYDADDEEKDYDKLSFSEVDIYEEEIIDSIFDNETYYQCTKEATYDDFCCCEDGYRMERSIVVSITVHDYEKGFLYLKTRNKKFIDGKIQKIKLTKEEANKIISSIVIRE